MIHTACSTQLSIAISFGGPAWPISISDLNLGTVGDGRCLGAIFDITQGTNVPPGSATPAWIVGDTFLVGSFSSRSLLRNLTVVAYERRKTCIASSVPARQPSASRSYQMQLVVPQVSSALIYFLCILAVPGHRLSPSLHLSLSLLMNNTGDIGTPLAGSGTPTSGSTPTSGAGGKCSYSSFLP